MGFIRKVSTLDTRSLESYLLKRLNADGERLPCGCWLFDSDYGTLQALCLPSNTDSDLSEFLRLKLTETSRQSIHMRQEYASNLDGNVVFYSHPIKLEMNPNRFSLCSYIIRDGSDTLNSAIGDLARRFEKIVTEVVEEFSPLYEVPQQPEPTCEFEFDYLPVILTKCEV